jgi:hypothetical protein
LTRGTPNTALHRTPAASPPSPVSFEAFGDDLLKLMRGAVTIMMSLACVHARPAPPTPVGVAQGYDIGTDLKLMEAVRHAFQQSPAFALTDRSTPGLLFVTQIANSTLEGIDGRERIRYSIGFLDVNRRQIGATRGECWMDDLAACAAEIVRAARGVVVKSNAVH